MPTVVALLVFIIAPLMACADVPKAKADVSLSLKLENDQTGKQIFRCYFKNTGNQPIEIPDGYGKNITLLGQGKGQRWESRLSPPRNQISKKTVMAQPGQNHVLFELSVEEILFGGGVLAAPKDRWTWDWSARPQGPRTPFHADGRDPSLLPAAEFWVELRIGDVRMTSDALTMKLKLAPK